MQVTDTSKTHAANLQTVDIAPIIHQIKHYLPAQAALRDFIHHNSLHAYQHLSFFPAIFKASAIFGYQVTLQLQEYRDLYKIGRINDAVLNRTILEKKGVSHLAQWRENLLSKSYHTVRTPLIGRLRAQWRSRYGIELDNLVQPLLFRVLCSYLDQGVALWQFPVVPDGLLASLRALEKQSYTSFFKGKRAKSLFLDPNVSVENLLKIVVGDSAYYEQYLFDQQFSHQGWSGIVSALEDNPASLLDRRRVALQDLIYFELCLEIDALDGALGSAWQPLCTNAPDAPIDFFAVHPVDNELEEVFTIWQESFEWSYYDEVLTGMEHGRQAPAPSSGTKSFQALFCIDERECSIRRHIEHIDPSCETLGAPGFFGVEFYFQPENAQFYDKLCPAPVTPKFLVKEVAAKGVRQHEVLYNTQAHTLVRGWAASIFLGFWATIRLFLTLFRPKMSPAISDAFAHTDHFAALTVENKSLDDRENGLQIGFTVEEMTARVEAQLRAIGLVSDFAPLIYVIAHGSSSANNPHHGAHDCGACSGRPGSVNARVLAAMANHPKVRAALAEKKLFIPENTQFVGGLHDTAADEISFYDTHLLYPENAQRHQQNQKSFEKALDLNAKERSRRFASISTQMDIRKIRKAIKDRSVSMFEPRPELGHGTNTLCIVGSRELTRGVFLDRRAFLNSYDYRTDPDGSLLTGVMRPLGPVCGGINLEYYFSRVDNYKLGAGTKLPHNVMGLFGVANSSDGDLRPGLPLQMIEVHDPARLLIIVNHYPEIVLRAIQSTPEMYEWYINEWVHLVAVRPDDHALYQFKGGLFVPYQTLGQKPPQLTDFDTFIENAVEMETNQIVHATQEHLPVHVF